MLYMTVKIPLYIYIYVCVCVCVCVWIHEMKLFLNILYQDPLLSKNKQIKNPKIKLEEIYLFHCFFHTVVYDVISFTWALLDGSCSIYIYYFLIYMFHLWTPTHGRAKAGRPARTYIQQLCEDTGCCPEDLPRAMNDREEWQERVRDIRATSAIWWWSYFYISLNTSTMLLYIIIYSYYVITYYYILVLCYYIL